MYNINSLAGSIYIVPPGSSSSTDSVGIVLGILSEQIKPTLLCMITACKVIPYSLIIQEEHLEQCYWLLLQ